MDILALINDIKYYEIVYEGDNENVTMPLGQSIGIIISIDSVLNIIEDIINVASNYLKKATFLIK